MSDIFQNTTGEDYESLPPEDICMRVAFGRFDPPLARFPHCIFVPSLERYRIAVRATGCKAGLFGGISPLVRPDGSPYVPAWEGGQEDFVFWQAERNQGLLEEGYGPHGAQNAPLIIDARTPVSLLRRMDAIAKEDYKGQDCYDYCYDTFINAAADFIEELGWAYIPLEWESEFAMFVTSREKAAWVEQVRAKIGPAAFSLIRDGDRWRWPSIKDDPINRASRLDRRRHCSEPEL